MFYHAFPSPDQPPDSWIAYHLETLTPVSISLPKTRDGTPSIILRIGTPPQGCAETNAGTAPITAADLRQLSTEIRTFVGRKLTTFITSRTIPEPFPPIPEHLIAWRADSTETVVIRTADPVFIIRANDDGTLSTDILRFASAKPMPAEGWAYFWEDAARALDEFKATLTADTP